MQWRFGHAQEAASDPRILEHGRPRNNQPRTIEHGVQPRTFEHPIRPRILCLAFGLIGDSLHPQSRFPTLPRRIHVPPEIVLAPTTAQLLAPEETAQLFIPITARITRPEELTNHCPRDVRGLGVHPFVLAPVAGTDAANPSQFRLRSGYHRNVDHAKSSAPGRTISPRICHRRTVVLVLSEAVLVLDYGSERANAMGSKVDSAARPDRSLPIRVENEYEYRPTA